MTHFASYAANVDPVDGSSFMYPFVAKQFKATFSTGEIPAGYSLNSYSWSNNSPTFTTMNGNSVTDLSTGSTNTVMIETDINNVGFNLMITATLKFTKSGSADYYLFPFITTFVRGISPSLFVSGLASVQKGCYDNVTYTIQNFQDSGVPAHLVDYVFNWTYPATWTLISGATSSSIVLKPNCNNTGPITCTVRMNPTPTSYFLSRTITPTRANASVKPINNVDYLCPNTNYILSIPQTCGADKYNWSLPGWTILTTNNTATSHIITAKTPTTAITASQATISCSVSFPTACTQPTTIANKICAIAPTTVNTPMVLFKSSCNDPCCSSFEEFTGQFIVANPQAGAKYQHRISSSPITSSSTLAWSAASYTPPSLTVMCHHSRYVQVRAVVCGSIYSSIGYEDHIAGFCSHTDSPCRLANPNNEIEVYPNPLTSNESLYIKLNSGEEESKTIQLFNKEGVLISTQTTNDNFITMQMPDLKNGIYFIKILSNNAVVKTEKLIINSIF
jgi:hypothetical protein